MYQLVRGCHYEGPYDQGEFFYELDNAAKRALFWIEMDGGVIDIYARTCWTEINDDKILQDWEGEKVWFKMREDSKKINAEERSLEYMYIKKVIVKDSLNTESGIEIYSKEET